MIMMMTLMTMAGKDWMEAISGAGGITRQGGKAKTDERGNKNSKLMIV